MWLTPQEREEEAAPASFNWVWCPVMVGHHDHMFKVLIIGDVTVGKTSLVQRYANDSFNKHYKSTVGGESSGFFSGLHKEIYSNT